ncbi:MAG: diguanylate cyclase [Planctomycetaceae bacterium]|nr:diguanylate cyclase [Planctomycetaceae bacterium]
MSARPFTILIVSPDRSTLRRLSRFVEAFGYDVRQAADGAQALAAADAAHPDFLLLDASSGEPADLALCRQIRKLASHVYTYSLMLTADAEVARLTEALEAGFDDFLAQPVVFGELLSRLRAGARVIEFERRLAEQTGLDPVTGLPTRAALLTRLHLRLEDKKGDGGWLAILDLDYFSRVHTRHGRPASEQVLRAMADLVRGRCGNDTHLAALGDDRVAVLATTGPTEAAVAWADQTLATVGGHQFSVGGQPLKITASCGLTSLHPGDTVETVLARAEKATQLAKGSGRGCVATSQEVDRETDQWAAMAAKGELFATTLARDVMMPCALFLHQDESIDQAHALMELTRLTSIPVVDNDGKLVGVANFDKLDAARNKVKPRGANSVKLVRHVMSTDVPKFDEQTPLSELMEYFTGESAPLAVVVRDRRPRGIVHCQGLAALNERLTADHFHTTAPRHSTSEDLLVPDLAIAE